MSTLGSEYSLALIEKGKCSIIKSNQQFTTDLTADIYSTIPWINFIYGLTIKNLREEKICGNSYS